MLKSLSNFFISKAQIYSYSTVCLLEPHQAGSSYLPVGWREVYLIFMAVRPLRAGVITEEWSMLRLKLDKTLTSTPKIKETKIVPSLKNSKTRFLVSNHLFSLEIVLFPCINIYIYITLYIYNKVKYLCGRAVKDLENSVEWSHPPTTTVNIGLFV